ncbi:hypothetical protein [Clostridium kluyveri]|uniref:Secreted protein n=2 Tax=Clostridium kluyveri TaxID=1534 RepID=A5MYV1_CLOK5|nr:hypothetical protein [Clostridium kluyveri]EDK34047.1 Hypothetical protein CKL_2035 [Clostridium kluyveri DSM 555]BAH06832.1 hypothetical protein CKR_1781 [Clostridium kluyveri NBRC 12016]
MLKFKHKLLSALILAAPLLLNTGIATSVHASDAKNISLLCQSSCPSTASNNCTDPTNCKDSKNCTTSSNCINVNGVNYDCGNFDYSALSNLGVNCTK